MGPRASSFHDLRQRMISGALLGGAAFGLLWLGGTWSALLVAALAAAMAWEWRGVTTAPAPDPPENRVLPVLAPAGAVLGLHFLGWPVALGWLGGLALILAVADWYLRGARAAGWAALGGAYIGIACMAFLALRAFEPFGFLTAFWIVLVVAAADSGGYFAGRLIGGPKLWPSVSPKKTWAGLAGGMGLAFLVGGLFSWATTGTYFQEVCTVSAIAALLAQAGDLAESALKRHFGVKESGDLIPGHGGALDRCDGLTAATLVAAAVTFWRGQTVFIW